MTHSTTKSKAASDSTRRLWADCVPLAWKPYIQLTRIDLAAGILVFYWPFVWGLSLVAVRMKMRLADYIFQSAEYFVWATLSHSIGSIWNDICDRDFDRLVERTKKRPLASGAISVKAAILWMSCQLVILLGLVSQLPRRAIVVGIIEIWVIAPLYPLMKRITNWPQAWLGMAIFWGSFISWTVNSPPDWKVLGLLLFTSMSWTIFFDTIYAMMDRKDDINAGVKSTALLFGTRARLVLCLFAVLFITGLIFIGLTTNQRLPFFVLSVLGSALHMSWQITTVAFDDQRSCLYRFESNGKHLGFIVWSGIAANYGLGLIQG